MGCEGALEGGDVAYADGLDDLEVGEERLLEDWAAEHCAVRDTASEHLGDDVELVDDLDESGSHFILWCATDGGEEEVRGTGIVELNGAETRSVKVPAGGLGRVTGGWELNLGEELVGLVVEVGLEVGAEEKVDDCDLEVLVLAQVGCLADGEKGRAELGKTVLELIGACEVKVDLGCELVHGTAVYCANVLCSLASKLSCLGHLACIESGEDDKEAEVHNALGNEILGGRVDRSRVLLRRGHNSGASLLRRLVYVHTVALGRCSLRKQLEDLRSNERLSSLGCIVSHIHMHQLTSLGERMVERILQLGAVELLAQSSKSTQDTGSEARLDSRHCAAYKGNIVEDLWFRQRCRGSWSSPSSTDSTGAASTLAASALASVLPSVAAASFGGGVVMLVWSRVGG